jgi:hypothetical protein
MNPSMAFVLVCAGLQPELARWLLAVISQGGRTPVSAFVQEARQHPMFRLASGRD